MIQDVGFITMNIAVYGPQSILCRFSIVSLQVYFALYPIADASEIWKMQNFGQSVRQLLTQLIAPA